MRIWELPYSRLVCRSGTPTLICTTGSRESSTISRLCAMQLRPGPTPWKDSGILKVKNATLKKTSSQCRPGRPQSLRCSKTRRMPAPWLTRSTSMNERLSQIRCWWICSPPIWEIRWSLHSRKKSLVSTTGSCSSSQSLRFKIRTHLPAFGPSSSPTTQSKRPELVSLPRAY